MIIKSILDTDFYKITQQFAVVKLYPITKVRYSFINRGKTPFPDDFAEKLRKEIKEMESLSLTKDEKMFLLNNYKFLDPPFIDYLSGYRFDSSEVGIIQDKDNLQISIEGLWSRTILWEVPLMAIISELYFKETNQKPISKEKRKENNISKCAIFKMNAMYYTDFGTRRRFSYNIQDELIEDFVKYSLHNENFVGTSNVHFAHKYNVKAIGTMAHEFISMHGGIYGYNIANEMTLENWNKVFKGELTVALTDTYTVDVFYKNFNKIHSKIFDLRQDSGDPFLFVDKTLSHFKKMNIDPLTKTIIFSDSLTTDSAVEINKYCRGKIKCSFGIGTNFTNNVGVTPLNIVVKLTEAKLENDWVPIIKLSDADGKHTGDEKEIEICKHILKI